MAPSNVMLDATLDTATAAPPPPKPPRVVLPLMIETLANVASLAADMVKTGTALLPLIEMLVAPPTSIPSILVSSDIGNALASVMVDALRNGDPAALLNL